MIRTETIDQLATAIAQDSCLRSEILSDPLKAIEVHNLNYARRFHQPLILFNESERLLVEAIPGQAGSILEVYQFLANAIENQEDNKLVLSGRSSSSSKTFSNAKGRKAATAA